MDTSKSRIVAVILSFFFGVFGADRFYLGYTAYGVLKLMTLGGFGIWWLIDFFLIVLGNLGPARGYFVEDGPPPVPAQTAADTIKKYYELFQAGAITEAEYQAKKAELLDEQL